VISINKGVTLSFIPTLSKMSRIAAIFGATGTQGSAVLESVIADKTFTPRAITRNPDSESSKKLASRGVQVVKGDLWNKESLKNALKGSEVVFGITNFYDPSIVGAKHDGEIDQGKILIDTCKEVGVKFLVWSSLPHVERLSGGKYKGVHHCDNKFVVQEYLEASGLPSASIQTGWFAENLWNFGNLLKKDDGSLELAVPQYSPDKTQAVIWVETSLGPSVVALFKHYDTRKGDVLGKTFYVANAHITYPDLAKMIEKSVGKPVKFTSPPTTGMRELDVMYAFQSEFGLYRDSPLPDPRLLALGATFSPLEEFVEIRVKPKYV
jgi:uncharacterized protein YbjT (DUF2867 family)